MRACTSGSSLHADGLRSKRAVAKRSDLQPGCRVGQRAARGCRDAERGRWRARVHAWNRAFREAGVPRVSDGLRPASYESTYRIMKGPSARIRRLHGSRRNAEMSGYEQQRVRGELGDGVQGWGPWRTSGNAEALGRPRPPCASAQCCFSWWSRWSGRRAPPSGARAIRPARLPRRSLHLRPHRRTTPGPPASCSSATASRPGWALPADQAYPALIGQRLKERGLGFEVVNAGVSGDTSAGGCDGSTGRFRATSGCW
jgi:hypothetical protein